MKKNTIKVHKNSEKGKYYYPIMVKEEQYIMIKEMAKSANISISKMTQSILNFGIENTVIEDEDENE